MSFKRYGFGIDWCWLPSDVRYLGYDHDYYDGDFWCLGFWFFHVYVSTNPYTYLSEEEIAANVARWTSQNARSNGSDV